MLKRGLLFSVIVILSIAGSAMAVPITPCDGGACLQDFFDDQSYAFAGDMDGNGDFCDVVKHAESIEPVPEPASMLLLGSGLLGLAIIGRGVARRRARSK